MPYTGIKSIYLMQNELFHTADHSHRLQHWQPENWPIDGSWSEVVAAFFSSPEGVKLAQTLQFKLDTGACIYPPTPFRALELTPLNQVKVVILGQDPYHGAGQAHGLAFSVPAGVKIPPSLRNIFKEIGQELGNASIAKRTDGCLVSWARQGVLLLNTCLSVESGQPASHAKLGWEVLTDAIIRQVAKHNSHVVFLLWGAHAQTKQQLLADITPVPGQHLVLCANHPSPLSAMRPPVPFLGCMHFTKTNQFLREMGIGEIKW